jgi:hypothetical protein
MLVDDASLEQAPNVSIAALQSVFPKSLSSEAMSKGYDLAYNPIASFAKPPRTRLGTSVIEDLFPK